MTSPIYTAIYDAIDAAMDDVADMDTTREAYAKAATEAAMKACGPRELVWDVFEGGGGAKAKAWNKASYLIMRWSDERFELVESYPGYQGHNLSGGFLPTLEAAKAAAQAHADAAHWANTVIGAEVGNG